MTILRIIGDILGVFFWVFVFLGVLGRISGRILEDVLGCFCGEIQRVVIIIISS